MINIREKFSRIFWRALNHLFVRIEKKLRIPLTGWRSLHIFDQSREEIPPILMQEMKISTKILLWWITLVGLYALALFILPHQESPISSKLNRAIQGLLFIISGFILKHEINRNNKFIFINFAIFFSLSVLQMGNDFIGFAFLADSKYAAFYYFQYLYLANIFMLSLAVLYLVVDVLFHDFSVLQKYVAATAIVVSFFLFYFHPFFSDPQYLYSTQEIKQWKSLSSQLPADGEFLPSTEIASRLTLQSWENGAPVGDLYPEENLRRIEELTPYLSGDNWMVLFLKPIYLQNIRMNIMLIACILLFFGYQYKKDPPQGAYFDKIMFLLLLLSSMEILHNYGYIKSVEWGSWTELFSIGQYVTFVVEILMVLFFALRLNFITSVQGEYYESELASNPTRVTRWRDWVDNLVLSHFFDYKLFNGRLFQKTSGR